MYNDSVHFISFSNNLKSHFHYFSFTLLLLNQIIIKIMDENYENSGETQLQKPLLEIENSTKNEHDNVRIFKNNYNN